MFIWELNCLGGTPNVQRGKGFFKPFSLKLVRILGFAFWTEDGNGLGVAVEGIYIFI